MSKPNEGDWNIDWLPRDGGRKPRVKPNPAYPNGKEINFSDPNKRRCTGKLPYVMWQEDGSGRGLGLLVVTCNVCGLTTALTTAGRPDDPISLTQNCKWQPGG